MNSDNGREFHTVRGYELLRQQKERLTPAMEDYLEMVYRLCELSQYTRIGKLSDALHVRPSSASKMIVKLSEKGFVEYDRYEIILPTEKGKNAGAYLLHRHQTIERFLCLIGSKEQLLETELIEHVLSPGTVCSINTLLRFFERNDLAKAEYESFQEINKENA